MGSANQINVKSVYRHTVCNCERASVTINKIAAVVHTQLHGVLHVADYVHTDVSEVVSLWEKHWFG